ncbi:MAG: hypothetical protein Q8Q62_09985 [Mesorhizobium sp.]|nr:hypothetical protein [Mesorhizobium sp.]
MARRLNALLFQVEMVPKARVATREQLTRIFALEAEATREEIEALDLSAKRAGGHLARSGPSRGATVRSAGRTASCTPMAAGTKFPSPRAATRAKP